MTGSWGCPGVGDGLGHRVVARAGSDEPGAAVELSTARTAFVATRLVIGATFALVPQLAQRGWLGAGPGAVTGSVALRAMGARDVALSVGALVGEHAWTDVRAWLFAAAWSEAADALAVLAVALGSCCVSSGWSHPWVRRCWRRSP